MPKLKDTPEQIQLNNTWNLLNLIRDMLGLARKSGKPSYSRAMETAQIVAPDVFHSENPWTKTFAREPRAVVEYRQKGTAENANPIDLLWKDIEVLDKQIETSPGETDALQKTRQRLITAVYHLTHSGRVYTEEEILRHDYELDGKDGEILNQAPGLHKDIKINSDTFLRVRFVHPGKVEHLIGSDLIYEVYDKASEKIRFLHVQYKLWDGESLYWSKARNLQRQLDTMTKVLCSKGYCKGAGGEFRYPFCCAFLRPTDKVLRPYKNAASSGLHIQVCDIDKFLDTSKGNKILRKASIENKALSSYAFDELFRKGFVGSRWLTREEVDQVYQNKLLMDHEDSYLIHATQYST